LNAKLKKTLISLHIKVNEVELSNTVQDIRSLYQRTMNNELDELINSNSDWTDMDSSIDSDSDSSSESGNDEQIQKEDLSNVSRSPGDMEKKLIRRLSSIDSNKNSTFDNPLRCPICLDEYKLPKALPCQHSFCAACLKPLLTPQLRINLENYRRYIVPTVQCPICRKCHALKIF